MVFGLRSDWPISTWLSAFRVNCRDAMGVFGRIVPAQANFLLMTFHPESLVP